MDYLIYFLESYEWKLQIPCAIFMGCLIFFLTRKSTPPPSVEMIELSKKDWLIGLFMAVLVVSPMFIIGIFRP